MLFGFATIEHAGRSVPAITCGEDVWPLADLVPIDSCPAAVPDDLHGLLVEWDSWTDAVEKVLASSIRPRSRSAAETVFLPPLPAPSAVYCAGANYRDHVEEMGATPPDPATDRPFHFLVPPTSLSGHGATVPKPPDVRKLDWEAELVAVIGRTADDVDAERALDYVAGYTVANDLSCRDERFRSPMFGIDWMAHKGRRALTPVGPSIVPARFVPDPLALSLRLSVNETTRQDSTTGQMIFSVAQQIAALSALTPLQPGDLVLTGTPAGTAGAHGGLYLEPGDVVVAEIDGIGRLENRIG
ncbi:fumarylacetoacetate hydrolase family protein [Streptomyces fulvoviolaceus]|uniref:fumarylacetoacetate hydrolase family protein n=1 Tax=Streptomyces fulvoviolaceus TaxID=285535 RepID=UPI000693A657|nr:fumarylacetoacetate hydrolase family protein [Streptomyces fulvoviolaceus]